MTELDVSVDIEIAAAPADVAAVMFDPTREAEWMKAVTGVEMIDPALAPGARVRHTASFMGREVSWTTAVETVQFPHVLTLAIDEGVFRGTVSYTIARTAGGSRARIRGVGQTASLGLLPAAMVEGPARSALREDLERLRKIIET